MMLVAQTDRRQCLGLSLLCDHAMPGLRHIEDGAAMHSQDVPALLIIGSDAAHRSQFVARLHALTSTADTTANAGKCSHDPADRACHRMPPA
jgi:hypothetical protein